MVIHQKRIIPKCWLTEQQNKEANYKYLSTLENKAKVVFAGDSLVEYFPVDQLINKRSINRGIAGYTSNQLVATFDKIIMDLNPEVVVLSIGANDCYYRISRDETVENIKSIFNIAYKRNRNVKIVLWLLLPTDNRLDYKNQDFEELNKKLNELPHEFPYVSIFDIRDKFVGQDGRGKQELYIDGLHPNARGYNLIADKLNTILKEIK